MSEFSLLHLKSVFITFALCWMIGCTQKEEHTGNSIEQYKYGESLFQSSGCGLCHSLEGKDMYGPALDTILSKQITVYRNEKEHTLIVDQDYIQRAIKNPDYEKVKGYQSRKMPLPRLNKQEIDAITDYLVFLNQKNRIKS